MPKTMEEIDFREKAWMQARGYLMFENGYKELMTVEIDKFYVKKEVEKKKKKTKKRNISEL